MPPPAVGSNLPGILRNGFARVWCGDCAHEFLLGLSCKRRRFCPPVRKRVVEFGEWPCEDRVTAISLAGDERRPVRTG